MIPIFCMLIKRPRSVVIEITDIEIMLHFPQLPVLDHHSPFPALVVARAAGDVNSPMDASNQFLRDLDDCCNSVTSWIGHVEASRYNFLMKLTRLEASGSLSNASGSPLLSELKAIVSDIRLGFKRQKASANKSLESVDKCLAVIKRDKPPKTSIIFSRADLYKKIVKDSLDSTEDFIDLVERVIRRTQQKHQESPINRAVSVYEEAIKHVFHEQPTLKTFTTVDPCDTAAWFQIPIERATRRDLERREALENALFSRVAATDPTLVGAIGIKYVNKI